MVKINNMVNVEIDPYKTDPQLLQDIKGELNDEAWKKFYEKYRYFISTIAAKNNVVAADRDGIVNDVLAELWRTRDRFEYDPEKTFRGWLYQMVRHYIFRTRRSKIIANTVAVDPTEPIENGEDDEFDRIWKVEWAKFVLDRALKMLQTKMDPKSYQVFYAVTLGEKKSEEVAREFGIKTDNVYSIKFAGKKLLEAFGCSMEIIEG
ncbi:MAG: sigma-70 family RNA polymerase sigma factor [Victivallales bacterium]|nr:sigma-70 family RNA polymerase sigma factor [Victivallales bacterium]